jgi:hypothetical protein
MSEKMSKSTLMYDHGARKRGKESDTYYTPLWVVDSLGDIFDRYQYLDPCPGTKKFHTKGTISALDGLAYDWGKPFRYSFVNPPFSDMAKWINHAAIKNNPRHASLWFTKLDFRTQWGKDLVCSAKWILPVLGYVRYLKEDGAEHGSATFQTAFAAIGDQSECAILKEKVIEAHRDRLWIP